MIDKIKNIIFEVKEGEIALEDIKNDSSIIDDIGMDSLQMINFILKIEEEFDITIDFDNFDFSNCDSVSIFCDFLNEQSA